MANAHWDVHRALFRFSFFLPMLKLGLLLLLSWGVLCNLARANSPSSNDSLLIEVANYEQFGNYEAALERYRAYTDSIKAQNSRQDLSALAQVESRLTLKREKERQQKEQQRQATLQRLIFIAAILLMLSLAVLFVYLRFNYKKNEQIKASQQALTQLSQQLEEKVRREKEKIARRAQQIDHYAQLNSHGVRAHLTRISGITTLLKLEKELEQEEWVTMCAALKSSIHKLDLSIKEIEDHVEEVFELGYNPSSKKRGRS